MARRTHLSGCLSGDFGPCNCEEQVTPTNYKAAIKALGLSQERAGDWLGIGRRTSQGYALGEYPVPEPVAKLLRLCVKLKLKPEDVK